MQVFGYGSLVNIRTHAMGPGTTGRLPGWRRAWVHTSLRPLAILTARPDATTEIDGLTLTVPETERPALLIRESAYDSAAAGALTVFTIPPTKHPPAPALTPILLSYLDVVVQGYLDSFGPSGVARFFETTDGWDAPILDDRAAPRYPRHQRLTDEERALTDRHLSDLGATLIR